MGALQRRGTLAALLFLASLPVTAKDTVTWFVDPTFPPAHISTGRYAGGGQVDRELNWLIAHLPQFNHVVIDSVASRSWREIGQGADGRCVAAALKTPERQKLAVFSRPSMMSWSLVLVTRQDLVAKLAEFRTPAGGIDLDRLIKDNRLHGVLNNGRSYGTRLDGLLNSPEGQRAVQPVGGSLQGFRILAAGRAEFALGYAQELAYFRQMDGSTAPLAILTIDGVDRFSPGYVGCSDGPVGRAVVTAVNEALAHETAPPSYIGEARQWYDEREFAEISAPALWTGP